MRGFTFEHVVVIDKKGNVWLNVKGERKRVVLSEKELEYLSENIVTHNHTEDVSFSIDDLVIFFKNNVKEMRICSPNHTYIIKDYFGDVIDLKEFT